jgi:hypothetical protein
MTPTRQHDPTVAIWGRVLHNSDTKLVNPSSVKQKALWMVSLVTTPCVSAEIGA